MNEHGQVGPPLDEPSAHPSVERIADYAAGLFEPAGDPSLTDHLAHCARCGEVQARLTDVTTALAAASDPGPPPAAVLARVEAALARAADARTLPERPAAASTSTSSGIPRLRRWAPRALGAAAALALVAVGYAAIPRAGGDFAADHDESTAGGAQAESAPEARTGLPSAAADAPLAAAEDDEQRVRELAEGILTQTVAEQAPAPDGQGCGQRLAQATGRELIGSTTTTWAGRRVDLVVVTGPVAPDDDDGWLYVLPSCTALPSEALHVASVDAP